MTVRRGPLKSVYAGHAALHSIGTGLILTYYTHCLSISYDQALYLSALCLSILALSGSLPVYSCIIRLSACLFSHDQALCLSILALLGSRRLFSHCQAHCLSSLSLSGSYSHYQAHCMSTLTRKLAAYLFCHSCSYPFSHSDWLPI